MDSIAVLLPSSSSSLTEVHSDFIKEYAACLHSSFFFPVLYNEYEYIREGADLIVNIPAPIKSQYCILRGDAMDWKRYDGLCHTLKRFGYYPVLRYIDQWATPAYKLWLSPEADSLYLERVQPYNRYAAHTSPESYHWFPSLDVIQKIFPAVAKNSTKTLCNSNGNPIVFDHINYKLIDNITNYFSDTVLDTSYDRAPMWFESYVPLAENQDVYVEWRAFYYRNNLIYLCPKYQIAHLDDYPHPPQSVLDDLRSFGFQSVDLALTSYGDWKILKVESGECSIIPKGGSAEEFYKRLEVVIKQGPHIPEWSWCLVGNIVESHLIGEDKRMVYGSKHFAPKTKVYIVDAFWGQGAERCTVLGIPRYADHLIGVSMATNLIENFRCEKVFDRNVLNAMWTNRLTEDFERDRHTPISSCWDNSAKSKVRIEGFAESANEHRV